MDKTAETQAYIFVASTSKFEYNNLYSFVWSTLIKKEGYQWFSILKYNGTLLSFFLLKIENSITPYSLGTTADGWEILSKDSHRLTWAQETTVAIVAGALAVYLATLGPAGVIAAMGTGALGVLAASSSGGTLYIELHMYTAPFVAPQYRYVWSFTASTGDKYGPYYTPA